MKHTKEQEFRGWGGRAPLILTSAATRGVPPRISGAIGLTRKLNLFHFNLLVA